MKVSNKDSLQKYNATVVNEYTYVKFNEQVVIMSPNELEQESNSINVTNVVVNVSFKTSNPQF